MNSFRYGRAEAANIFHIRDISPYILYLSLNKQSEVNSFRYGRAANRGGVGERASKGGKEEV